MLFKALMQCLILSLFLPVPHARADRQLTTYTGDDRDPAWSPDGSMIAYSSYWSEAESDLFLIPPAGGAPLQLTTEPFRDIQPAFSPDGTMIAFASDRAQDRPGQMNIWVMPSTGGEAIRLTDAQADDRNPTWSADGYLIAFSSDRTGDSEIWITPSYVLGPSWQLTFRPTVDDLQPEWSPDGTQLLFSSCWPYTDTCGLWSVPSFGILYEWRGSWGFSAKNPSWYKDGRGYVHDDAGRLPGGRRDIYTFRTAPLNLAPLTLDLASDENPTASPDMLFVAFESDRSGNWDIWVTSSTSEVEPSTWGAVKNSYTHRKPQLNR